MPSASALGALISEHRCGRRLTILAVLSGPLLLLTGAGLVVALFVFPEPDRPSSVTVALTIVGLALFALGVAVLVVWNRKRRTRVLLHEGGIVELLGPARRELLWRDVATFSYTAVQMGTYLVTQLTIEPKVGRRWRMNSQHLEGLEDIASQLAAEVTNLSLPQLRERLAAGERLGFGKLALSPQGIHKGKRLLPWSEVAGVWVHQGYVRVLRHGDATASLVVNAAQLERTDALLTLIRENCRRPVVCPPFAASTSFRQLLPRLVAQTVMGVPLAALFFGFAGYNLWRAFRSLSITATNHYRGPAGPLAWALLTAAIGALLAAGYYYDLARHFRQRRVARRLAKDGKLVPVMVLENKFEEWSFYGGWRYRYLTPHGFEGVDRIDVPLGGAAPWSADGAHLLALCSPDERESVLISMSGYPLAQLPAIPKTTASSPS